MSFVQNKFEFMIAALVLVMMWGASSLFKAGTHGQNLLGADIVYEMPRPKSFNGGEFDLSGREIDRRYLNPFEKKKALEAAAKAKGSVEANAKAAAAAKVAQENAKKSEAAKKAKVTARVITKDAKAGLNGSDGFTESQNQTPPAVVAAAGNAAAAPAPAADSSPAKDDKLSPAQWIALILGQPTQANMYKLMQAIQSGDAEQDTFYTIVSELLKSTSSDKQKLALYAVNAEPTAQSFAAIVENEVHLSGDLKAKAETFLESFKAPTPARASVLAKVLQIPDAAVVVRATSIFIEGYAAVSLGTQTPTPGSVTVSIMSVKTYSSYFVSVFTHLQASSDETIRQSGQKGLSTINISNVAANN
jgi:hypothetical protein